VAGLKLRAGDAEDLAVISAILQDALVSVGEMIYLPEESRFVLVANRFRWEPQAPGTRKDFERTLSGLRFDGVTGVQRRGFHPREEERILSLLAIRVELTDGPEGKPKAVILEFAGGSSVRLEVGGLLCHLDDLGEPWPTRWRPKHPVAESD
jgi:hypothetical protein